MKWNTTRKRVPAASSGTAPEPAGGLWPAGLVPSTARSLGGWRVTGPGVQAASPPPPPRSGSAEINQNIG